MLIPFLKKLQDDAVGSEAAGALLQSNAVYAVHPQGKNTVSALFAIQLPPECTAGQLENLLKAGDKAVNIQAYHGTFITSIGTGNELLHTAAVNNIALFSPSLLILQNAIRHVNSGTSLNDNEQFKKAVQTSGAYTDVRLFVNNKALPALVAANGSNKWKGYATTLAHAANWTALDGQISPGVIHLNGFIFPSFTDDNYLPVLLSQKATGTTAWEVLPATTGIASSFRLSDASRFFNQYKAFLDKHKSLTGYLSNVATLSDRLQTNAEELFLSFYAEEAGTAYLPGPHAGWVSLFKTANRQHVLTQLETLATDLNVPFKVNDAVYHNPAKGLLSTLFGEVMSTPGDAYFTIHDNWVVFGDSPELLASLATGGASLKKRLQGSQASQYYTDNSVFSLFIQPDGNNPELLSYLSPSLQKQWKNALAGDAFKVAGLQMRPSGDKLYTTFFAIYDTEEKLPVAPAVAPSPTAPAAQTHTATPPATANTSTAVTAPGRQQLKFPVVNHNNKQTEYLVQHNDHTIALTAPDGATLWQQKIDGPILDTVYQLDFYKNGKLQMLFITANKMYLIDRKGQTVAPFPLSLSTPARKLSLFDYDKNKEYRLFVVQNNSAHLYDKKGRAVDGWKVFTPAATITRAPEFFRIGGRDYIAVCDEKNMYLLDRRGNERVALESAVAVSPTAPIVPQQQPPALKVKTTSGATVVISLKDGKVN